MHSKQYIRSELLEGCSGIEHGFFTRVGGVSKGDFDSLNCSPFSGDDPGSIEENRKRICRTLRSSRLSSLKQVHSNQVYVVGEKTELPPDAEGDGLVSCEPFIAVGAMGADCAPVLFADPQNRIIGAAHAGWKGAVNGVTDSVIETMCDMGSSTTHIRAAIGPAIQQYSYEVGQQFADQFLELSPVDCEDCFAFYENRIHFNLPLYIKKRLLTAGLTQVDCFSHDTYKNENLFFSYRRACHRNEKNYGRQMGAISLVPEATNTGS